MRGLDLSLFQFDWDTTFAAMFLNADGTIYARYGTRNSDRKGSADLISIASFRKCMERVLALHAAYPGNKALFAEKKGKALAWRTPEAIPNLASKFKAGDLPKACIHCHHVTMGIRREAASTKKPLPDNLLWMYPLPDAIGIHIDVDEGNQVASVVKGSAAEKAGLAAGDVIDTFDGQAVTSTADIQWVLQNASDKADFQVGVRRGSEAKSLTVSVSGPWKHYDISWRESLWDLRSGISLVPLSDDERKKAGIGAALALKAKFVAPQGNAKKAGFQQDDVLVEVDGKSAAMSEGELLVYLRQKYAPGAKVPMTVQRGGKKVKLTLELN